MPAKLSESGIQNLLEQFRNELSQNLGDIGGNYWARSQNLVSKMWVVWQEIIGIASLVSKFLAAWQVLPKACKDDRVLVAWQDCKRLANILETWWHAKTSTATAKVS